MTHRPRFVLIAISVFLLTVFCLPPHAFSQSATATLSGTVEDQNGAVVSGASVTVLNTGTSLERHATTNDQGYFTIPLLPPGSYNVTTRRDGFAPVEFKNVVLNVNDQKTLQIQLKAGDVKAEVQVTNEVPLINESQAVATVVDRQFVENLPLNGRSFQSLISLTPGVVVTPTDTDSPGQFSVNGQRANANYFTVDGISANVSVSTESRFGNTAAGSVPGLSIAGTTSTLVSVDALQEFRVQTSTYAPEFGRSPGAQVQIVTRSGANQFRGTLFEYFRNEKLDANNWFANSRGLGRAPLRQNDFGGVIGGPVFLPRFGTGGRQPGYDGRSRTFFFFSFEGLLLLLPQVRIIQVPTVAARGLAPASLQPFLNAYPLPTGPAGANGLAEFATVYSDRTNINATSIRIDHRANKLSLFGRYNHAPSEIIGRVSAVSGIVTTSANMKTLTVGATLALTAGISNELIANYSHAESWRSFRPDAFGGAIVPPANLLTLPPSISRDDASLNLSINGTGGPIQISGERAFGQLQRQINLVDNLSVVSGAHQLKFGIDYRRLSPLNQQAIYRQDVSFNGLGITAPGVPPPVGSVLSGKISSGSISASPAVQELLFTNLSIYGQDTWRVLQRLTLTYGTRWEVNPPFSERNGLEPFTVVGLDNPATLTLGPRGKLYETTYNNFAPRIGVAYQLSQKAGRENVIRGGFGIFYDLGAGGLAEAVGTNSLLTRSSKSLPPGTPYPPDPSLLEPASPVLNTASTLITVADPHLKLPLTYQWNLAVEQSLGSNQTISASYVAAAGRRLLRQENLRRPALGGNLPASFFGVNVTRNGATSDYHALQLQYQRRLSRGLQALTSYTWSHSIDIISLDTGSNPGARYDPRQDRGSSDFDVRHALTGAVTYNLPGPGTHALGKAVLHNWSIDTLFIARSATPVNIVYNRIVPGIGFFGFRPDLVPGIPLYLDDPTVPGGKRINGTLVSVPGNPLQQIGPFLRPVEARQGTLGRNVLRGFPAWQIDFALRRQFKLTERLNFQLKAEMFNAFNHPNFANPDRALVSNTFGQSLSMLGQSLGGLSQLYQLGGPRSIQLTLKIQF